MPMVEWWNVLSLTSVNTFIHWGKSRPTKNRCTVAVHQTIILSLRPSSRLSYLLHHLDAQAEPSSSGEGSSPWNGDNLTPLPTNFICTLEVLKCVFRNSSASDIWHQWHPWHVHLCPHLGFPVLPGPLDRDHSSSHVEIHEGERGPSRPSSPLAYPHWV